MTSIFDIYREMRAKAVLEAEGDEETAEASNTEETPAEGEATTEDNGGDDDFSIDASLDDGGDEGMDDGSEDGTDGNSDSTDSSSSEPSGDEEVNDDNTDIFYSLTAEEQQIKIKELKRLYHDLYSSCEELLDKLNTIEANENNLVIIGRISSSLTDLKKYISDYLVQSFPSKSFVENDIAFNRFLLVINSIKDILERYSKKIDREEQEN